MAAELECGRALVKDPSGTPLNVRLLPGGDQLKVGQYNNEKGVRISKYALAPNRKVWAFVSPDSRLDTTPEGWVLAEALSCEGTNKPASTTTAAAAARPLPQADRAGNFFDKWSELWRVVDSTPLNCREKPQGGSTGILATFSRGEQLTVATQSNKPVFVNTSGTPWVLVKAKRDTIECYVRANNQQIVPHPR